MPALWRGTSISQLDGRAAIISAFASHVRGAAAIERAAALRLQVGRMRGRLPFLKAVILRGGRSLVASATKAQRAAVSMEIAVSTCNKPPVNLR